MSDQLYFHGTDSESFDEFKPSLIGTLGFGIYFTEKREEAACYGNNMVTAKLIMSNPWRINMDYEDEMSYIEDFDHPAISPILDLPGGRYLVEKAKSSTGMFDARLTNILKALGYDSIIGTYPDNSIEAVVFDASQVQLVRFELNNSNLNNQNNKP